MPRAERVLLRAFSLLLSVTVGLFLFEIGWRVVKLRQLTIPAGLDHPHFHHRLAPNQDQHYWSSEFDVHIRTNRYGLRGPDPAIPKPPGVIRVLLLGDSFTFGFPVKDEEAFAQVAQELLRAQGYPVEVINGGVSGYATTLHYVSLRDQYLAFEPDLVLLWYDLGDLQEDAWFQKNLVYDAQGHIERCDPRYINGRFSRWEWLRTHSLVAGYLDRKLLRTWAKIQELGLGEYLRTKRRGERAKVAIARKKTTEQAPDLASTDRFLLVRPTSTPELIAPYWALSAKYLRLIHALLQARDIPFVMGIYPYGMLVGPDQWASGRKFWGFEPGKTYSAEAALTLFTRFSAEENIPLLNTFDRFRAAAAQPLFYAEDGHMTPAGQRIVAEAIAADPTLQRLLRERAAALAAH